MKHLLIFLFILCCYISESKAGGEKTKKHFPPPANEIEATSTTIRHRSGLKASIKRELLAENPAIQGPLGVDIESRQALIKYSAIFIKDPQGQGLNQPTRIEFWLARSVEHPTKWSLVTPNGVRSLMAEDRHDDGQDIDPTKHDQFYFEEECEVSKDASDTKAKK